MRVYKCGNLPKFFLFVIFLAVFFTTGSATAVEKPRQADEILLDTYHKIKTKLDSNSFGFSLYLESSDQNGRLHADVYGVFEHPFGTVLSVLKVPSNWCDIACLHPNVKACTYRELPDTWLLTLYNGRKFYQPVEDASRFTYSYRNIEERRGYLNMVLSADEGPYGTTDHKMRIEAARLDGARTLVHVSYACRHGFSLNLAEKVYFATLGRGKVGFTVNGTDGEGNAVYIRGPRGAIERNAVRYYFAVQSFMNSLRYPEEKRFSMMISEWYDLTDRYKKQLYELDKKDYLAFKTEEHKNQVMLQRWLSMTIQ